jgi:hypothetical protein
MLQRTALDVGVGAASSGCHLQNLERIPAERPGDREQQEQSAAADRHRPSANTNAAAILDVLASSCVSPAHGRSYPSVVVVSQPKGPNQGRSFWFLVITSELWCAFGAAL